MTAAISADPIPYRLPLADADGLDGPWVHVPSGARFTQGIAPLVADGAYRYDDDGANVSVRYRAHGLILSVYVFPLPAEAMARASYRQSVSDMMTGLQRPLGEVGELDVAFARAGAEPVRGWRATALGATPLAARSVGVIEMYAHRSWGLKFRVTCTVNAVAIAELFVERWLLESRFGAPGVPPEH